MTLQLGVWTKMWGVTVGDRILLGGDGQLMLETKRKWATLAAVNENETVERVEVLVTRVARALPCPALGSKRLILKLVAEDAKRGAKKARRK